MWMQIVFFHLAQCTPQHSMKFHLNALILFGHTHDQTSYPFSMINPSCQKWTHWMIYNPRPGGMASTGGGGGQKLLDLVTILNKTLS